MEAIAAESKPIGCDGFGAFSNALPANNRNNTVFLIVFYFKMGVFHYFSKMLLIAAMESVKPFPFPN